MQGVPATGAAPPSHPRRTSEHAHRPGRLPRGEGALRPHPPNLLQGGSRRSTRDRQVITARALDSLPQDISLFSVSLIQIGWFHDKHYDKKQSCDLCGVLKYGTRFCGRCSTQVLCLTSLLPREMEYPYGAPTWKAWHALWSLKEILLSSWKKRCCVQCLFQVPFERVPPLTFAGKWC